MFNGRSNSWGKKLFPAALAALGFMAMAANGYSQERIPTEQEGRLGGGKPIFANPAQEAQKVYQQRCATCHTDAGMEIGGRIAPTTAALKGMQASKVYESMVEGKMKAQADGISDRDMRGIAMAVTGKSLEDTGGTLIDNMANNCATNPAMADLDSTPAWNGWSPARNNARFQTAQAAKLSATDVPKLKLKWAFGLPMGASSSSQPTVVAGRVFVGSDNATVYSLDAKTGCAYWSFKAKSAGRFAPIVAPISGYEGVKYAVFFVTGNRTAYAIDAQTGKELWQSTIPGNQGVSNSAAYQDGRLYVPLTGFETMAGSNPKYECCKSRGGVASLDANSGKLIWHVDIIPEPLEKIGTNNIGTQLWGPSGASVWNTPTIDAKRGMIYVGTGNSFGPEAAKTSDSIVALNMKDGSIQWWYQEVKDDAFMLGCPDTSPAGGNCPQKLGPDWDLGGASAILQPLADGKDILVAAGKGGVAFGLDPDQKGKLIWRTPLHDGKVPTADGLVLFGGASDGNRVYFPMQREGGGLKAVQLATGKVDWDAKLDTDARGQIGAASAIPGVVFTGAWDGTLRAVDMDGKVIWSYDTRRRFDSVNGVVAVGGSLGSPGPTIADGMLYLASGYVGMQNGIPGNVILAFAVE